MFVLARLRRDIDLSDFACGPRVHILQPEAAEFNPAGGGVIRDRGDAVGEFRFRIAGRLSEEFSFFLLAEDFSRAPIVDLQGKLVGADLLPLFTGTQHLAKNVEFMIHARVTGHLPRFSLWVRFPSRLPTVPCRVRRQIPTMHKSLPEPRLLLSLTAASLSTQQRRANRSTNSLEELQASQEG